MKPSIPEVLPLFQAYHDKPENGAWGSIHIVLDDGNVDDKFVLFCKQWANERGDSEGEKLCDILLLMSKTQRLKLGRINTK